MESADNFVTELGIWHSRTLGHRTVEALRKNNFDAGFFESRAEVLEVLKGFIKPGNSVAFGGSQTVRQLGVEDLVKSIGAEVLDHNADGLSPEEKFAVMRQQQLCDVFICSANAISVEGEIYNVDGNGNRLSAMIFGPLKVIVLAGINKICADEAAAWNRIRQVAAPMNLKRLNRPNPCTTHGTCLDCKLPTRGCNAYLCLRKKPSMTDFSVFIVNEPLGF